ncbi:2-methylisocitrate lyase-like PEP mutase family enzyme [Kibdelosporangium banguiense]|uniref:2-methylisocitrate lyase-like PEP mutase family enzyme n=1 Tax=Kibdelosporangium banguiense TaxID=1365924 RepID=A0ABS4TAA8_9PSEU|nr:isocitrate lyase/phosphoenolpyruvate mutase family protein [Kibdelosporangium banguiense]MBP2321343.1 2-methylisocitrate lyase-like PEP mutase family enzyme [Kibdelosporangium banguiense]
MIDQATKAAQFRALHERPEPFLLPNPWDTGTARLLASLGFEALASTSLGVAAQNGNTGASARQILDNCRELCEATALPVNADLENCFADDPAEAAKTIELAVEAGVVGASIEDFSGDPQAPIYEFELAVDRVRAAVEVARGLPVAPVLTARAENLLHGVNDLDDTIRRLQAFEEAGADVLYAPGLRTLDEMRAVVSSVGKPVNVVMGFADPSITLEKLGEIGVRRVSIGGALARIALQSFMESARQMRAGRFGFVADLRPLPEIFGAFPRAD